jgi:hypothetical protein
MNDVFTWLHRASAPAAEKPFRDELLSIERLEERALALAASFTVDPSPRRRARNRASTTTRACCGPPTARWPATSAPAAR